MNAAQIKAVSDKINNLLPDDPRVAVTVLALNYACVARCTGMDDESALEAVRRALRQMRTNRVGELSPECQCCDPGERCRVDGRLANVSSNQEEQMATSAMAGEGEVMLTGTAAPSEAEQLRAEIERLRAALTEIENPIAAMKQRAEAEGGRLNTPMALQMSNDPNYLKQIAKVALSGRQ